MSESSESGTQLHQHADRNANGSSTDEVMNTAVQFVKKVGLCTGIYLFGYYAFSIAWLYCILIALQFADKWGEETNHKWRITRALALGKEKRIILSNLNSLPSWVNFPDIERAEWLNRIIRQMWVRVNHYTKDFLPQTVQPIVQSYLKSFKFEKIILGKVPFRIDGIKVYTQRDITRDKIVMDVDLSYAGDCHITFSVYGIQGGGIQNFQLRGKLRIVMKPLISTLPLIGGLQLYFLEQPEIDFDLVGATQIMAIPGLRNTLHNSVLQAINSALLFPNVYPVRLSEEVEGCEVSAFEPEGVLRVHAVEARHLMRKDIGLLGNGKSDPYAILSVGPRRVRTQTIFNTVDPKWDFWCEFEVESNSDLDVELWDQDEGSKDETLGNTSVSIANVARKGQEDLWIPLEGVMHGNVHVRLIWLSLTSKPSDLDAALTEAHMLGPNRYAALFMIYLDSAKGLSLVKSSLPDPYVVLQVEKKIEETEVYKKTCDPIWERSYSFMIVNPKTATLDLKVIDKKSGNDIGSMVYSIAKIMEYPESEFRMQPFMLRKSGGQECFINLAMKLRFFKGDPSLKIADVVEDHNGDLSPLPALVNSGNSLKVNGSDKVLRKQESTVSTTSVLSEKSVDSDKTDNSLISSSSSVMPPPLSISDFGSINLTLRYSDQRQKLIVVIHKVVNIPLKSTANVPDPYVKMYLLSGKSKDSKSKRKTRPVKNDCNPVFEESFEYLLSTRDLSTTLMEVTVATEKKSFVMIGTNVLGQVIIDLGKYGDLTQPENVWFHLKRAKRD